MKNILVIVLVGILLVVGGKFYLEYRYKKELDKVLPAASLVAEVVYKDLNVGFDGTIELLGLNITPNGGFDTFAFRSIKVSGFDLLFHFNGKSRIQKGDFPKFVNFDVDQFSFPASIYEEQATSNKMECRSLEGTLLYSSAGFDQIVFNGRVAFDLADPFAASIEFTGRDQISRTSFSMNFNARQLGPQALAGGQIPIQSMRYDYALDEAAASAILEYCADKFKITSQVFVEKVIKSEKFMTNSFGLDFGERARQALADFLQGGKEIVIRSTPSDRLKNMNFASNSSPAQIVRMLNLNVSLDGSTVPLSTLGGGSGQQGYGIAELDGDKESTGFKRRDLETLLSEPDGTVQERVKPKVVEKRRNKYSVISLNRVADYIDRDVRVSRSNDRKAIAGRLLSSEEEILSIETYRYGGVVVYTVPHADVAKIELKKRRGE